MDKTKPFSEDANPRLAEAREREIAELRERTGTDPSSVLKELCLRKKSESAGISVRAFEYSSGEEFERLFITFRDASYDVRFSVFLDYLDAFSKNKNEDVSDYGDYFFTLLKNALSRAHPTQSEAEFFADILPRFIRKYRQDSSFDQSYMMAGFSDVMATHPELSSSIPSIISEGFLNNPEPKGIDILSFLGDIEFVSKTMVNLLSSDTSWAGTFLIDNMFVSVSESLGKAKAGRNAEGEHTLSEKEFSSVSDFLLAAGRLLPDTIARGQGVLLKKGLTLFLSKHPEFEKTAEKLIEGTKNIPFSEKGEEEKKEISEEEKKRLFGNFDFLGDLLLDLPENERKKFLKRLEGGMEFYHAKVLKQIFRTPTGISEKLAEMPQMDILDMAQLDVISELIALAVKNIEKYRFQIGVLLSLVPFSDLPPETRIALRPVVSSLEQTIKPGHTGWYLCPEAEKRLVDSLADDAVVLVNDSILIKMAGKFSGLCVKNYKTKDGFVFVEGAWYSPSDAVSRRDIREANDRGQARVEIDGGEWSLMRAIEDSPVKEADMLLAVAKGYAENLGNSLPQTINGLSRKEFRERKIETE